MVVAITKEQRVRYNKQRVERRKKYNEEVNAIEQRWKKSNLEKDKAKKDRERVLRYTKGGDKYEENCEYRRTGIQGERNKIRRRDRRTWQPFKNFIALDTEVHHAWIKGTANYNGVAIVDKSEHGIINPILILENSILICPTGEQTKWL